MAANEKGCEAIGGGCFWAEFWKSYEPMANFIAHDGFRNGALVVAAIVTLVIAIWRAKIADDNKKTSIKQADTSEASHNIDRFHKGVEMLSSNSPFMAAAGARMLGGLARNSMKEFYPQVARILTSYIREISPSTDDLAIKYMDRDRGSFVNTPEQCAAVLIELSLMNDRRISEERFPHERVNLRKSNLANIKLIGGNFAHTIFSSSVMRKTELEKFDLSWANFYQCDLRGANFTDSDLTDAFFIGANLELTILKNANFENVKLHGAKNLTYTQLSQAKNVDPEFLAELKAEEEAADKNSPT